MDQNKPPLFGCLGFKFYSKYAAEKYRRMLQKADKELEQDPQGFNLKKHIAECEEFILKHGPAGQFQKLEETNELSH